MKRRDRVIKLLLLKLDFKHLNKNRMCSVIYLQMFQIVVLLIYGPYLLSDIQSD